MTDKPRILYISSASPVEGPGAIGGWHYSKLKEGGFDIDMLTLYKEPRVPDVIYLREKNLWTRIKNRIRNTFQDKLLKKPYCFFYKKEDEPPIPVDKVLKKIAKPYDLIIVYFWQELLSFRTIEAIYDKLGKPVVFFLSPDYSHMSGGCHFPCNCLNYQIGCGCCPAIHSKNEQDFTRWNVIYRKRFYEKVKPVVFGNSYMNSFYKNSFLLKDARIVVPPALFDVSSFRPVEVGEARKIMGIVSNDNFVIAFGCQALSDPRKGISYLIEALMIFKNRLSYKDSSRVILLIAGDNYNLIKDKLPFCSINKGFISRESLSVFYSAADIFVCSSVDDAGPSMVAQSIACGTPVVGFKMGAMLDAVLDRGTGYCAELKDCNDLAKGIEKYFRMNKDEYSLSSKHCRQYAIDNSNFDDTIERWMSLYEKYRCR